jgi:signal transduction histidine kinase
MLEKMFPNENLRNTRESHAVLVADSRTGCIQSGNSKTCQLLKCSNSQLIQKEIDDFIHHSVLKKIRELSGQNGNPEYESEAFYAEVSCYDGSTLAVEMSLCRLNINREEFVMILFRENAAEDFLKAQTKSINVHSKDRRLEDRRLEDKRLEELCLYSNGIVHDLNNIFTAMHGYTYMVLDRLNKNSRSHDYLEKIDKSVKMAINLTQKIYDYINNKKIDLKPLKIKPVVEEIVHFLEISIRPGIRILRRIDDDLPILKTDAVLFKQVLMNLILNAADAIDKPKGVIEIKLSQKQCSNNCLQNTTLNYTSKGGEYMVLQVIDSGCGISPEKVKDIFTPFITTKSNGRGLGLASVSRVIKEHGGAIDVKSTIGKGTQFTLLFPLNINKKMQVTYEACA